MKILVMTGIPKKYFTGYGVPENQSCTSAVHCISQLSGTLGVKSVSLGHQNGVKSVCLGHPNGVTFQL